MNSPLVERIHRQLLDRPQLPIEAGQLAKEAKRLVRLEAPLVGAKEEATLVEAIVARVQGLGPLDEFLNDPAVTEVMVNGGGEVWLERFGALERSTVVLEEDSVLRLIDRIVSPLGLRIDRSSPMVDARLADGSRVNAVVRPIAIDGPCLTIRRFRAKTVPLEAFCSPEVAELLAVAVAERRNVLVSGGTGAGKTTLLNALGATIPTSERVVTIEDAAELRLPGEHVVRLESRPANADGLGTVGIRDLVRNALRMRPDRIVVGEVRGGEALDMLQAMNTGHDGSLSTCHANSPEDALRRIETLALLAGLDVPLSALREQLVAAIDLVVQVARSAHGGRRIVSIAEPELAVSSEHGLRCSNLSNGLQVFQSPSRLSRFGGGAQ